MTEQIRTFTGTEARQLMRSRSKAALSSLNQDGGGPYASLVNVATMVDGSPIILISTLAWHTQNLLKDGRGALMFDDTDGLADPLTGPRVTVMGRFQKTEAPDVRRRDLARHPAAELYVDFGDFSFWTLSTNRAHAVAGFGKIETLSAEEVVLSQGQSGDLAKAETDIVQHMNNDHAWAIGLYATKLSGQAEGAWKMTALDPDGVDLATEERSVRLTFETPVTTANQARKTLIDLAKRARA